MSVGAEMLPQSQQENGSSGTKGEGRNLFRVAEKQIMQIKALSRGSKKKYHVLLGSYRFVLVIQFGINFSSLKYLEGINQTLFEKDFAYARQHFII